MGQKSISQATIKTDFGVDNRIIFCSEGVKISVLNVAMRFCKSFFLSK